MFFGCLHDMALAVPCPALLFISSQVLALFQDICRAYVPKTMTLRASLSFLLCLHQATLGSSRLLTATSAEADVWTWERLFSSRVSLAQGCLNFLHIPKTAGTTIEHLSPTVLLQKERGEQSWGAQDHLQNYCSRPGYNPRAPKCYFESSKAVSGGAWCSPWHVPPSLDERLHEHYAECTTFCVVRHPAERLVSQFRHEGNACNLDVFRRYVAQTLPKVIQHPFKFDCHFLPQVELGVVLILGPHPPAFSIFPLFVKMIQTITSGTHSSKNL